MSNSFIENRWTNKQTDKQTNMTDYPIVAEGAYNYYFLSNAKADI